MGFHIKPMKQTHSPNDPVIHLKDSGYQGAPHIPSDPKTGEVVFVWWASTPQQRQSIHRISIGIPRLRLTDKFVRNALGELKRCYVPTASIHKSTRELRDFARRRVPLQPLPAGYQWWGPFLYMEHPPSLDPEQGFRSIEPEFSEDTGLAHLALETPKSALALRLARKILADRAAADPQALHLAR